MSVRKDGQHCSKCFWLKKYFAIDGAVMQICDSEDLEYEDEGLYLATVIFPHEFDASYCLDFKEVMR